MTKIIHKTIWALAQLEVALSCISSHVFFLFSEPLQQMGVGVHSTNASHAAWEAGEGESKPQGIVGSIVKGALSHVSGMFLTEE